MGLLGKKLGMTQIFAENGECIPVTVVQTSPCVVTAKRTPKKDGYSAIQLGFGDKPTHLVDRASAGFFKKAGVTPKRRLHELRLPTEEVEKLTVGQELKASDVFTDGVPVDVQGISKGRGFQGVMKRHGMSGTKASHGVHEYFRHGGSIGCRLTPGRVFKGKHMPGHMGNVKKTVQNLELISIVEEDNCVLIRGSIPGANNSDVLVRQSQKLKTYRGKGSGEEQVRSKNPLKASKAAGSR